MRTVPAIRTRSAVVGAQVIGPDLYTQLEELLIEVWEQEKFERTHPFTCAVMREPVRKVRTHLN